MSKFMEITEMRVLPTLISFVLLIIFLVPVEHGIINLGNIAGAAVSAGLTAVFMFFRPFRELVSRLWDKPAGRAAVCVCGGLFAAFVIMGITVSFFMVRAMNDRPAGKETTLVVLGCKVKNGRPSLMLKKRLDAAYGYLAENDEVCVVVSGGKGNDEAISEAQCMKEYLTEKGIAPERVFMEDRSVDTEQNLRFSREIIQREGLPETITIVTDGYHQLRAEMLAEKLGMEAYNISAETSWWLVPTYWVREWFGVTYYALKK